MYKLPSAPLITAQQINARLDSLAQELKAFDFDVILSALTGSYIFTADLSRDSEIAHCIYQGVKLRRIRPT